MARYKDYDYDQMKMIPVSFDRQILPGSFEYSLAYLIDNELDLSAFDQHYCNDDNGRPAYDPRLLLKIIILAYSKGITSSRQIELLCRENITFMALSEVVTCFSRATMARTISVPSPKATVAKGSFSARPDR